MRRIASLLLLVAVVAADRPRTFDPVRVVGRFTAIRVVPVVAGDAVAAQVTDNELVIGVVVNGQARAYPINMLTGPSREIMNDTLGGRPIAATW